MEKHLLDILNRIFRMGMEITFGTTVITITVALLTAKDTAKVT
jgi:hypothetical protein